MLCGTAHIESSLSLGPNCGCQPLKPTSWLLIHFQECKLAGCNLNIKIMRNTDELREHILTGHLNNLKLPCPIKSMAH